MDQLPGPRVAGCGMSTFYQRRGKRTLDALGAAAALIVASPLLAGLAFAVRRKLGSPILFRQQRAGLSGSTFTLVKFRTMLQHGSSDASALTDEERTPAFGRWLRSTSLDELPELWNVLTGDMSFVGPRPLPVKYLPRYTEREGRRHHVRPGLTGWAQVNGRNEVSWEEKLEMDVWYVDHVSLATDARVVFKTVGVVLRREGIGQGSALVAPEFRPDQAG